MAGPTSPITLGVTVQQVTAKVQAVQVSVSARIDMSNRTRAVADYVVVSDAAHVSQGFGRGAFDVVTAFDAHEFTHHYGRELTDSITVTDASYVSLGYQYHDSAAPTDTAVFAWNRSRDFGDTGVFMSDSPQFVWTRFRTIVDSVTVTDSSDPQLSAVPPRADFATASDSVATAMAYARTVAGETVVVGDANARAVGFGRALSDSTAPSDATARAIGFGRTRADTATPTDAQVRSWARGRSLADSATPSDSVSTVRGLPKNLTDTASPSEAGVWYVQDYTAFNYFLDDYVIKSSGTMVTPTGLTATISDTATISEAMVRAFGFGRTVGDSATPSDTVVRAVSYQRMFSDTATTSDDTVRTGTGGRSLFDTATVTDATVRASVFARTLSDSTAITDATVRAKAYPRTLSDTTTISDAVATAFNMERPLSDSASATDATLRATGFNRTSSDSVTASDSPSTVLTRVKTLFETVTLSDTPAFVIDAYRDMADTSTVSDTLATAMAHARAISDSATLGDSVSPVLTYERSISDSATPSDSPAAVLKYGTPIILNRQGSVSAASNSTTFVPTLPGGSGNRLIAIVSSANAALLTPSTGWTKTRQWAVTGLSQAVFWKDATGSDALTVTSGTSTQYSAEILRVPTGTCFYVSPTPATATGTNSNPPSLNQLKSRDTLWLATRTGAGTVAPSVAPSGYTMNGTAGTASGAGTHVATKTATSSTEDPGTFTSASALWISTTIALWMDYEGPALERTKAALSNPTRNYRIIGVGDSQESGAISQPGGTDTMTNAMVTCRARYRADYLTAMTGSHAHSHVGTDTPTSGGAYELYDPRWDVDASFGFSTGIGASTLGRAAWNIGTSGQMARFTPGVAFDRIKITFIRGSGANYSVNVNGGSGVTLTCSGTAGFADQTISLSGNSSAVINIVASGAGGAYILLVETWTNGVNQVNFLNAGYYGCNTNQVVDEAAYYSALPALAYLAPDLTIFTVGSNDSVQGVTQQQTEDNLRKMFLTALASGEAMYSIPNYYYGVDTATMYAAWSFVEKICQEMGLASHRLMDKTGFSPDYAATVAAGNCYSPNNHLTAQGQALFAGHDNDMYDPGP